MEIYIHRDSQQFGPYSLLEARKYLASGQLLDEDLAWHEGAADWAPLAEVAAVPVLVSPPAALPPPLPVTALATVPAAPASVQPPRQRRMRKRSASSALNQLTRQQKSIGMRNMALGAVFCVGGIIVTVVSYSAVSDSGGSYFIAWGAILFGAIRFLKGMVQASKA